MASAPAFPPPTAAPRPRFRITVDRYARMIETGVYGPEDRVELLDGEIVEKMAIGDPHFYCVKTLNARYSGLLLGRAVIGVQDPVELPESVPEPDVALLRPPLTRYRQRTPTAEDCFLVVEVAETSLYRDRVEKAALYAAAGIVEYWVVDLPNRCVWVHLGPQPDGAWTNVEAKRPGAALAPQAFPDAALDLAELLA